MNFPWEWFSEAIEGIITGIDTLSKSSLCVLPFMSHFVLNIQWSALFHLSMVLTWFSSVIVSLQVPVFSSSFILITSQVAPESNRDLSDPLSLLPTSICCVHKLQWPVLCHRFYPDISHLHSPAHFCGRCQCVFPLSKHRVYTLLWLTPSTTYQFLS